MSDNFYQKGIDELRADLEAYLEEREALKVERDRAKEKLRMTGMGLPKDQWDALNKRIQECNKATAAIRKRITSLYDQERRKYTSAKRGQDGYFRY